MPRGSFRPVATCHPDRLHRAKGLCEPCYAEYKHVNNPKRAECHPERPLKALGLCSQCYKNAYNKKHPKNRRNDMLLSRYGLTEEAYNALYQSQGGLCAICKKPPKLNKHLCVDHNHACCPGDRSCGRCVRGLLCRDCNTGLGNFRDKLDLLAEAQLYLVKNSLQVSSESEASTSPPTQHVYVV